MTVVNPKSISGINSITTGSGSDNLLTIHTSDASNTERVRINSSGDVIVGSGITVSPDGDVFTTGVTTATTFVGALTGNVTGNATGLSGTPNISAGTIAGSTGTFTGDVSIADKIVHTGDTNTLIRFPAAGTIRFDTDGNERARIDSSGRLLLGTTSTSGVSGSSDDIIIGSIDDSTDRGITIATTGIGAIRWADAGDNAMGRISYSNASDFMFFSTSNSEAMRIDSAGRVGIKNTNMSAFNNGMDDLVIGNGTNGTSPGMTIYSNSSDIGSISFRDSADTGISGLIQYRHLESPAYMRFLVEGTETAKFTTHGGIAFGSDTAAVNTLNDYEEGTWTPNIQGSGSNNSKTYSYQTGLYTKVGNKVTARFRIKWTSYTSDSGNAIVNGLPFTANDASVATGSFAGNNLNFPSSNHVTSALEVENGDTYMYILNTYDNAVWINSQASTFWQSTGEIRGEMTYFTNS